MAEAGGLSRSSVTKISQVAPDVTFFFRGLGFSDYYIIKIFNLAGEAAVALTEDNPYWLLDAFPRMRFEAVDAAAARLGFGPDSEARIASGLCYALGGYVTAGHTFAYRQALCEETARALDLSASLVDDVLENMAIEGRVQLSTLAGRQVVYFYTHYRAECRICGRLAALAEPDAHSAATRRLPTGGNAAFLLDKTAADRGIKLSPEQKQAALAVLGSGVSIITGGPGTGKTTLLGTLRQMLEDSGLKVAVAAPTGRAAKRLMAATGRPASTVHRLLEYYYDDFAQTMSFGRNSREPLEADAVIVDEASMLDTLLMGALCDALPAGCRLILVGDVDQLPPVGAGNVLSDLIESEMFLTVHLTTIFRQAQESRIIRNAHRIREGLYPDYGDDFFLIEANGQQDILRKLTAQAATFAPERVQVLTPVKKGILGSYNLNLHLQQVFNPPRPGVAELRFGQRTLRVGDRVMQTKNDYQLSFKRPSGTEGRGLFNGETGLIAAVDVENGTLTVDFDGEKWVEYSYTQLDELELAYAVTVHKSQGSEFPVVLMPMTWFPPVLATRNLLYTAVTRGREAVYIVGQPAYLNAMVDRCDVNRRNSGLAIRLREMNGMRL